MSLTPSQKTMILKELIVSAAKEHIAKVNAEGLDAQKAFLNVCGYGDAEIYAYIESHTPKKTIPQGFSAIQRSLYLEGRYYNREIVKGITDVVKPILGAHNCAATSINDIAIFEFSMSAKFQTLNGCLRGLDSSEAKSFTAFNPDELIPDHGERFRVLGQHIYDLIEAADMYCADMRVKDYGIMMDLE